MSVALGRLKEMPAGVAESAELIARLDQCFMIGFGRLGPVQHEALEAVAATFHGTPLQAPLATALDSIKRSEFLSRNFVAIAAARAAIQGAQYDALFRQAAEAVGRKVADEKSDGAAAVSPEGAHTSLLSSAQQWLMELALAGFGHLSMETLSPFMTTLEQIQAEPKLSRVASLLTGFLTELFMASSDAKEERPVFRWVDLWTRAMILSQQPTAAEAGASVSGTFYPFGVDVREHPYFVNILVYGLLEAGKEQRVVRISLSSYKVDVISREQVWHLFRGKAEALMEALAGSKALQVSNMTLLSSGEMIWTGTAKVGAAFNPIEKSRGAATGLPAQEPLSRHPVQLGELVSFEKCSVQDSAVAVDGANLPLAIQRFAAGSELSPEVLKSTSAMVGLLRFDGGQWSVQPLCVASKVGKKEAIVMSGSGALAFCKKDKSKTLATLTERAGKLLRE